MVRKLNTFIWVFLFLVMFIPGRNIFCADLSDNRKKEIVDQLYNGYAKDLPEVGDIKPDEVIRLLKKNRVVLIDVRTPAEMGISILPGAVIKDDYLKEPNKYKKVTVVAYCTIGYRSGIFAKKMAAKGLDVKNMAGGLLGWVFEGGRVYHEKKEVKRIHVYGPKWDYPPSGYESVMFSSFERLF
ncbi:MAG: rhodanese-like domain-containing protein [Desulfobacterales bacterium]|nr:rhodanese-like domain-containing protein [Desulfobacterales bacterium]